MKIFITALTSFLIIDVIWLGFIAREFYSKQIGFLLKDEINWFAAIIFYLIFVFGLVTFVIKPNLGNLDVLNIIGLSFLFGFVTYATYDLTNLSTIKDWPLIVTIVDMMWGGILATAVTLITYYVHK